MKRATILGMTILGLTLAGCSSQPGTEGSEEPDALPQGLTILEASPGLSFSASFARGENVIYLEAVRGRPTPTEYQQNPEMPQHEVDARIVDRDGRLLYLRRGGDNFVDKTWLDDLVRQDSMPPARISNKALFDLVAAAAVAIESELPSQVGVETAEQLVPEVKAIRHFGRQALEVFANEELRYNERMAELATEHEIAFGTGGPEDAAKYFGAGWYSMAVHDMGIALNFGRHSATRISKIDASGAVTYFDFCNHGDCASTMSYKCSLMAIEKPDWTALTCSTGYDWDSEDGGHNCHDDTRVQMAAFVYGPNMTGYQYWCNDGDADEDISVDILFVELDQDGSPECNSSTNKGYNHSGMLNFYASNTNTAQQNTANFEVQLAKGATYTFSAYSSYSYLRLNEMSTATPECVCMFDPSVDLYYGGQYAYLCDMYPYEVYPTFYTCTNAFGPELGAGASYVQVTAPYSGKYMLRAGCTDGNSCSGKINVSLLSSPPSPAAPPPTQTYGGSCYAASACGGFAGSCWCDAYCLQYGDCCSDGPC